LSASSGVSGEAGAGGVGAVTITPLARTLDHELLALVRGASLECLVCGEFVMRVSGAVACPECRTIVADGVEVPELELPVVGRGVAS
jgi:hypothetical protein